MRRPGHQCLLKFLIFSMCMRTTIQAEPKVTKIIPRCGSLNGATRITIYGENFASNYFTLGSGNDVGSKVTLTGLNTYDTDIHIDGSNYKQIMAYTRPMPEGTYNVNVTVNGQPVPEDNYCRYYSDCEFKASKGCTPTITKIEPSSGKPGEFIDILGNIRTTRYGPDKRDESQPYITRVYFGGQKCEIRDEEKDEAYNITFDGYRGRMRCKPEGTYIGNQDITYLVKKGSGYGRSLADDTTKIVRSNGIGMYQTYTEIAKVYPQVGGSEGGTRITISGKYFDETDAKVRVLVGGAPCKVVEKVTDSTIVCETPPDQSQGKAHFSGGRGWTILVDKLKKNTEPFNKSEAVPYHADESYFKYPANNIQFRFQLRGFFVAPYTGKYNFIAKSRRDMAFYISTNESPENKQEQTNGSLSIDMEAGKEYYLECSYRDFSNGTYIAVKAFLENTHMGLKDTGLAQQEVQVLSFSSAASTEKQTIEVKPPSKIGKMKPDVQEMVLTGSMYSTFAIGYHGYFTTPIAVGAADSSIAYQLSRLHGVDFQVKVSSKTESDATIYTITSYSKRGAIELYEGKVVQESQSSLNITVRRVKHGDPDLTMYSIKMNDVYSREINFKAGASQIRAALEDMFKVHCNPVLIKKSPYGENYEAGNHEYDKRVEVRSDEEAFCGKYYGVHPRNVYHKRDGEGIPVSTTKNRYLCFAYRSSEIFSFKVQVYTEAWRKAFILHVNENSSWVYHCEDLLKLDKTAGTFIVTSAIFIMPAYQDKLHVDEIQFFDAKPLVEEDFDWIYHLRTPSVRPEGKGLDKVSVKMVGKFKYEVEFFSRNCAFNIPTITVVAPTLDGDDYVITNAANVELRITVKKESTASPPITGQFVVSFDGKTSKPIPLSENLEPGILMQELYPIMGDTQVKTEGNCMAFKYEITMINKTGNQPEMQIDAGSLEGDGVTANVVTLMNGQLQFDPISGDHLRTYHNRPQVIAFINNVPTACAIGTSCHFIWDENLKSYIESISPTTGADGDRVTIQGSQFGTTNKEDFIVKLGEISCDVTSVSTTKIKCKVNNGPTGEVPVIVNIAMKGQAIGSVNFTFITEVQSMTPSSGSVFGGTVITLSGKGFNPDSTVEVGLQSYCRTRSAISSKITCIMPKNPNGPVNTAANVVVKYGGKSYPAGKFTFNPSLAFTPKISSISKTSSNVAGGETMTISGDGFGSGKIKVTLEDETEVQVSSHRDSKIVVILPKMAPGSYSMKVYVDNKGFADNRGIPKVEYIFKITSLSPRQGSLYGGTDILIKGIGFSTNETDMSVSMGSHICNIQSLSTTEIKCRLAEGGAVHVITNMGAHPVYGVGYAWTILDIKVKVGDVVKWTWQTHKYVKEIEYGVYQTKGRYDLFNQAGGFGSGEKKRVGTFTHQFTKTGIYNYWSGFLDPAETVFMRGTVTVDEVISHREELSVQQEGFYATHMTSDNEVPLAHACAPVTTPIEGCSDSTELDPVPDKFIFDFKLCLSPTLTRISQNNGTVKDLVIITGTGFGQNACQNEVKYAEASCEVDAVEATAVTVKISAKDEPVVGVLQRFTVRVIGYGYALSLATDPEKLNFGLLPMVSSVTPDKGSVAGGTVITITGAGFRAKTDDMTITMKALECQIKSATYTEIVCETICLGGTLNCVPIVVNVTVLVFSEWTESYAICKGTCQFETLTELTATVTSMTPTFIMGGPTIVQIKGSKFGTSPTNVKVYLGDYPCKIKGSITDSSLSCLVGMLPAGHHPLKVYVGANGLASTELSMKSPLRGKLIGPEKISIYGGGLLKFEGNGFLQGTTEVTVEGAKCEIILVTFDKITCEAPAMNTEGTFKAQIASKPFRIGSIKVTYSKEVTPDLQSIKPDMAMSGDTITLLGSKFKFSSGPGASKQPEVEIGGVFCQVTTASATLIGCKLGQHATGNVDARVNLPPVGYSNLIPYKYGVGDFEVAPNRGSTVGGQVITLTGVGFLPDDTTVTICNQQCQEVSATDTVYVCSTPPSNTTSVCTITVVVNKVEKVKTNAYTYDAKLVSTITSMTPLRGGTGGGTLITMTGTNLGSSLSDVKVTVSGIQCDVQSVKSTEIICKTKALTKAQGKGVVVQVKGWGNAQILGDIFVYGDAWSSKFSWGGLPPPTTGDFVVIPKGKKIYLDIDTPVLKMLLLKGDLEFDKKNLELQAENILIIEGGSLQIGSKKEPFPAQYTAKITLHGHLRSKELPVYGTKALAVREGTIELHGSPVSPTWTRLSKTANPGDTKIYLEVKVPWAAGDMIVIAPTGHHHNQKEKEVHIISKAEGDTLTLTKPLKYKHISIKGKFGFQEVEFRAEVGHFNRNIIVQGNKMAGFDTKIEPCPEEFNTGQFATQTCFQGRYGEEIGSDEFGGQIIIHQAEKDTQVAQLHMEYVHLTHMGQAFRLGRYPVHLHLNGNMNQSYVRGCTIHTSFNRAVNIHGSHYSRIEDNVIYNIMGGAFFMEDGNEVGNTLISNLAVFVKTSTSLRNDDVIPAAIWATNPNNNFIGNAMAGGTHLGIWYRMFEHPDGPGFSPTVCPQNDPLGTFAHNTAHTLGWFGIWTHEFYIPRTKPCFDSSPHMAVKFTHFLAWNCRKGIETVVGGSLQFHHVVLVNNEEAGFEGKLIGEQPPEFDHQNGPGVFDSLIVGHYDNNLEGKSCYGGIVLPQFNGFLVKNVKFFNFDIGGKAAFRWSRTAGLCFIYCGGFAAASSGLSFQNSPNRVLFEYESDGIIHDIDASLGGNVGEVAACTPSFDSKLCKKKKWLSAGVDGCICSDGVRMVRFGFNRIEPAITLQDKKALFTSKFGTTKSLFSRARVVHTDGWAVVLMTNTYYDFSFEDVGRLTNLSFDGVIAGLLPGNFVGFNVPIGMLPDMFKVDNGANLSMSSRPVDGRSGSHGDWFYDNERSMLSYIFKNDVVKEKPTIMDGINLRVKLGIIRCFYLDCIPPSGFFDFRSLTGKKQFWSDAATWPGVTGHGDKPVDMEELVIPIDKYIVVDQKIPPLKTLVVYGIMEFASDVNCVLEADHIFIYGKFIVGASPKKPFDGNLIIRLRGRKDDLDLPVVGAPVGTKFIAVYGGLQLHGKKVTGYTYLASHALPGATSIETTDVTDWKKDDVIVIATTSLDAWKTEVFSIKRISGQTIHLNDSIKYRHLGSQKLIDNKFALRACVAMMTRNIRIESIVYPELISESFGTRIIVTQTGTDEVQYSGFAQLEYVEFFHTGQEGYRSSFDARFSITYYGVINSADSERYSYVRRCAFHSGFNTAIGVFSVPDMEVEENLVHHTVGESIRTEATNTKVIGNRVFLCVWPGSYQERKFTNYFEYPGAIDGLYATDLILENNAVYGAERFGYRLGGQPCTSKTPRWKSNVAVGSLIGVGLIHTASAADPSCIVFDGFIIWKSQDYGFFMMERPSVIVMNSYFIENTVGVYAYIFEPLSSEFEYEDKKVEYINCYFVGKTDLFSYTEDVINKTDDNIILSEKGRSTGKACGHAGIWISTFNEKTLMNPGLISFMKFYTTGSYASIKGKTIVEGCVFEGYRSCPGEDGRDFMIHTVLESTDGAQPVYTKNITIKSSEATSLVYFDEPPLIQVSPANCVDMDCDGLKKVIIEDRDGSFMGHVGYFIPDSAYEWDGDPRHGLGDYRIPKSMLITSSGEKRDINKIAPKKGIFKYDECIWIKANRAFKCTDKYKYHLLNIQSLDADSETRRLTPVAIYNREGYVDLLNGQQDHGWCTGYACNERLSMFQPMVALGYFFEIFLTGVNPKGMRYMLPHAGPKDCILLSQWYENVNRRELYVSGKLVLPNNGYLDKNGKFRFKLGGTDAEYMPDVSKKQVGENFLSHSDSKMYWVMCGDVEVDITLAEVFIMSLKLPPMTEEEFFGVNVVQNLALFLEVPPEKIRIIEIIAESKRRKRAAQGETSVSIEIGDPPGGDQEIVHKVIGKKIMNQAQIGGGLSKVLNVSVLGASIQEPSTDLSNSGLNEIQVPDHLLIDQQPVGNVFELEPLSIQPRVRVVTKEGKTVKYLGSMMSPWRMKVSSVGQASVYGNDTIDLIRGWANFSDIAINLNGEHQLKFEVISPVTVNKTQYSISSETFKIERLDIETTFFLSTGNYLVDKSFQVEAKLTKKSSREILPMKGRVWSLTASIADAQAYPGNLSGQIFAFFDQTTGTAVMNSLILDQPGFAPISFFAESDPWTETLMEVIVIPVMTQEQSELKPEVTHDVNLKFETERKSNRIFYWAFAVANQFNNITNLVITDVYPRDFLYVHLKVKSTTEGLNEMIDLTCTWLNEGPDFNFDNDKAVMEKYLQIDGLDSTKSKCAIEKESTISLNLIPLFASLAVLVMVIPLLVLRLFKRNDSVNLVKVFQEARTKKLSSAGIIHLRSFPHTGSSTAAFTGESSVDRWKFDSSVDPEDLSKRRYFESGVDLTKDQ